MGEATSNTRVKPTAMASLMGPAVADPGYAKLKELIVVLYYYSEPALTQRTHATSMRRAPGNHRSPITPDTRPCGRRWAMF